MCCSGRQVIQIFQMTNIDIIFMYFKASIVLYTFKVQWQGFKSKKLVASQILHHTMSIRYFSALFASNFSNSLFKSFAPTCGQRLGLSL